MSRCPPPQRDALDRLLTLLGGNHPYLLPWRPGATLIGHYHINPVDKSACPGRAVDIAAIAARLNGTPPRVGTARYTPVYVRSDPTTASVRVDALSAGQQRAVLAVVGGASVTANGITSDQWAKLGGGGYVWLPQITVTP